MRRRTDVKPDNVVKLLGKGRIVGELEPPPAMWREAMGLPDFLDRGDCQPRDVGHCAGGPMRRLERRRFQRHRHDRSGLSSAMGIFPGGRELLRDNPAIPSSMKRACQRHTVIFAVPVCFMMADVPTPSALISTIRARQKCFCGVLRLVTRASRRRRSESQRVMEIPVRLLQGRTGWTAGESTVGLFRFGSSASTHLKWEPKSLIGGSRPGITHSNSKDNTLAKYTLVNWTCEIVLIRVTVDRLYPIVEANRNSNAGCRRLPCERYVLCCQAPLPTLFLAP